VLLFTSALIHGDEALTVHNSRPVEHVVARLQDGRRMTTDTAAAMLRGALVPTLVVGVAAAAVAGATAGVEGLWGALIGLALVVLFFGLGLVVLGRCAGVEPVLVLLIALGLYAAKVVLIGGTFVLVDTTGVLRPYADHLSLGVTAIACTLTWTIGETIGAIRARQPAYDLPGSGQVD
jgi:ATP synthase protein I